MAILNLYSVHEQ